MTTELPDALDPAGWSAWNPKDPTPPLAYYAEYRNTGPGASPTTRAPWSHQLTPQEARQYQPTTFLAGPPRGPDHWDPIAEAAKLP
jgi:hypothetical protein